MKKYLAILIVLCASISTIAQTGTFSSKQHIKFKETPITGTYHRHGKKTPRIGLHS